MDKFFLAILLLGLIRCVWTQVSFACAENHCKTVQCLNAECNGRLLKNATKCGCCHWCVRQLEEGSVCSEKQVASLPGAECGPGLTCSSGECRKMETTCMKDLRKHINKYGENEITAGPPRPQCDNFGDYFPVQCKRGIMCYCVNIEGKRIFGSAPYSQKNHTYCNCSIEYEKFKHKLEDMTYFLRCAENGNYDSIQCTDTSCFCMDENGEIDGRVLEAGRPMTHLKCYNKEVHSTDFLTPCYKELRGSKEEINKHKKNNVEVIGIEIPECDIDGSYALVQCSGDKCYCVNKNGKRYPGISVDRRKRNIMRCNCVREKDLLEKEIKRDPVTNLFSQYTCDKCGNYAPEQCVASVCYCVDQNGFQTGDSVLLSERYLLDCPKPCTP